MPVLPCASDQQECQSYERIRCQLIYPSEKGNGKFGCRKQMRTGSGNDRPNTHHKLSMENVTSLT